jgi:hypothetical protein
MSGGGTIRPLGAAGAWDSQRTQDFWIQWEQSHRREALLVQLAQAWPRGARDTSIALNQVWATLVEQWDATCAQDVALVGAFLRALKPSGRYLGTLVHPLGITASQHPQHATQAWAMIQPHLTEQGRDEALAHITGQALQHACHPNRAAPWDTTPPKTAACQTYMDHLMFFLGLRDADALVGPEVERMPAVHYWSQQPQTPLSVPVLKQLVVAGCDLEARYQRATVLERMCARVITGLQGDLDTTAHLPKAWAIRALVAHGAQWKALLRKDGPHRQVLLENPAVDAYEKAGRLTKTARQARPKQTAAHVGKPHIKM